MSVSIRAVFEVFCSFAGLAFLSPMTNAGERSLLSPALRERAGVRAGVSAPAYSVFA